MSHMNGVCEFCTRAVDLSEQRHNGLIADDEHNAAIDALFDLDARMARLRTTYRARRGRVRWSR